MIEGPETTKILMSIGGILLSIIGYFLRQTMADLKEVKTISITNKSRFDVLENDYKNKIEVLYKQFEILTTSIEKLTDKIDDLNKKM